MSAAPVQPPNCTPDPRSAERDALDRILRSDALHRAPNLVLFLRYVCERHLEGRTDEIKEYNIAVEALGRGSEFDQKKDSIVRVEAHRLRKRLAAYYERDGAADPVQIHLPSGSYVPVFRRVDGEAPKEVEPASPIPTVHETAPRYQARVRSIAAPSVGLLALAALATVASLQWRPSDPAPSRSRPSVAAGGFSAAPEPAIRIAAGSTRESFADGSGGAWRGDRFFSGGDIVVATARGIRRTTDDVLYLTRREGDFKYDIPVPPGSYELRLHFAETVFGEENVAGGGESSRVFQVQVNGGEPWTADIISEAAGENTATIRVYRNVEPASDGAIHVAFRPLRKEAAFVNGIEVLPAPDGRALPVRIVPRGSSLTLPSGDEWARDQYSLGGSTVQRHEPVEGPEPSSLYQSERFGNFSYAIPVATGIRYTLTLRFAETWFGPGRPGGGGAGNRVFDVYCNGRPLLRNFDVFRDAGGPMRQVKKVFRNLEPNAQGKLNLQFVPIRNYAMVNAIELTEERR